jgi:hypothetical protein
LIAGGWERKGGLALFRIGPTEPAFVPATHILLTVRIHTVYKRARSARNPVFFEMTFASDAKNRVCTGKRGSKIQTVGLDVIGG